MDDWIVLEDRIVNNKRWVSIRDNLNKREYDNYFPTNIADAAVINRFKLQVKEHRAELARSKTTLNLSNFEQTL